MTGHDEPDETGPAEETSPAEEMPPTPRQPDPIEDVREAIEPLTVEMAGLAEKVAELERLGRRHADQNDALYAENQRLRAAEQQQAQDPLFRDLVRLYDQAVKLAEATADPAAAHDLEIVADQLVAILSRNGIERFVAAPAQPFDSARHQGVGSAATGEPEEHRTVARSLRCGFTRADGRVFRPADVEVYRYEVSVSGLEEG